MGGALLFTFAVIIFFVALLIGMAYGSRGNSRMRVGGRSGGGATGRW